jgi:hypothetical protein
LSLPNQGSYPNAAYQLVSIASLTGAGRWDFAPYQLLSASVS